RQEALKHVRGDAELLGEMIELFLKEYPRLQAEIDAAVDQHDGRRLKLAAHTLKGAAGIVGAGRVVALAEQLEGIAGQETPPSAKALAQELGQELERVHQFFTSSGSTMQEPRTG